MMVVLEIATTAPAKRLSRADTEDAASEVSEDDLDADLDGRDDGGGRPTAAASRW